MRHLRFLLMLPAAALLACATPQVATARGVIVEDPDELVCAAELSGGHLPQRVCRSRAQLEQERAEAQRLVTQTWMKPRVYRR